MVDRRLLLDGGAPVLPHLARLGIDPGGIDALFLTHFHGDHLLGLPPFFLYRVFEAERPLEVVGPAGVEERLETLNQLAWGNDWAEFRPRLGVTYREAVGPGQVAGVEYEPVRLDHGRRGCTGYRLRIGDRLLAYAGDSEPTPPLDRLVEGADLAIVEATGPGQVPTHTSWEEAARLRERHPKTRFYFNHVYAGEPEGAARDLQVIEI
ncbi:MAG TPA: ribonuclease Z [Candidatus Acidoferrales bacterium]|nr:ribonuclease Z [Candidatus Acidoferrales bacterium]